MKSSLVIAQSTQRKMIVQLQDVSGCVVIGTQDWTLREKNVIPVIKIHQNIVLKNYVEIVEFWCHNYCICLQE